MTHPGNTASGREGHYGKSVKELENKQNAVVIYTDFVKASDKRDYDVRGQTVAWD